MSPRTIALIARKEVRDALRNRWFLSYALVFAVLSVALSRLSLAGTGLEGLAGFGRTTASLVNLVLLLVPLIALSMSATSIAGERERGTLNYLLAQPVTGIEVLLGKYLGLAVSLTAVIGIGFAVAGLTIAHQGGVERVSGYLTLIIMTVALGLAMLSVGMLVSALAWKGSVAIGLAVALWFCFTLLSDLGLMGGALAFRLGIDELFHLALINPLQVFKMSVLHSVNASIDVLGPTGTYATQVYGGWLPAIFAAAMAGWIIFPLLLASVLFRRRPVQ